jgi:cytochrome c556
MRRVAGAVVLTLAVLSAASAGAQQMRDQDVIEYRQNIMKTKDAQTTAIGQILATMVPNTNLASHFKALLEATRQSKSAFKPKVLGGESLPAVWENWADFSAKLDQAEKEIMLAIEIIEKNGIDQAGEAAVQALTCKGCHDIYRNKK